MNAYTRITPAGPADGTPPPTAARVGPNAITRMAQALREIEGDDACVEVFLAARLQRHLEAPPTEMVDEMDVSNLHRAAFLHLGPKRAARVSAEAGRLTGDYLLANRIPAPAQKLLRILPRPLAARLLLAAVSRHAWTFVGSGTFSYSLSPVIRLKIEGAPICHQLRTEEKVCHYFAATFERLFQAIISKDARVEETECESAGAAACLFSVTW
jgi:divinyl protochlorophyllide a 8-vinyl-reductase